MTTPASIAGTVAALTLALTALSPAQTVGPIERDGRYFKQEVSGTVNAGTRLRVSAPGAVSIRGRDVDDVTYRIVSRVRAGDESEARAYFEQARVAAVRRDQTVTIAAQEPGCRRCGYQADMEIVIPTRTLETILATRGGSLSVEGVEGRVNAESAGGAISLDAVGGEARATTAGGSITLGRIGGAVICETAGGSITLEQARGDATLNTSGGAIRVGRVGGRVRADSAGGGIEIQEAGGPVIAGTSGGSIRVGTAGGPVNAETAGGSIEVAGAPKGVRVETAAGDIRLQDVAGQVYAAAAMGDIHAYFISGQPLRDSLLETNAGSIIVWLPADIRINVEAIVEFAKNARRIESDFDTVAVRADDDEFGIGGVTAVGAINGGGPVLRVRNTSGRIEIRRRD